jgi:hypothetical protein
MLKPNHQHQKVYQCTFLTILRRLVWHATAPILGFDDECLGHARSLNNAANFGIASR